MLFHRHAAAYCGNWSWNRDGAYLAGLVLRHWGRDGSVNGRMGKAVCAVVGDKVRDLDHVIKRCRRDNIRSIAILVSESLCAVIGDSFLAHCYGDRV
jgi:hypothetical protein